MRGAVHAVRTALYLVLSVLMPAHILTASPALKLCGKILLPPERMRVYDPLISRSPQANSPHSRQSSRLRFRFGTRLLASNSVTPLNVSRFRFPFLFCC